MRNPWLLGLCLPPFLLLAFFSHPAADDFVYAARAWDLGFLDAQKFWYLNWCGRYFATFVQTGFPLAFDMTSRFPLVPLTLLFGFGVALAAFARSLNQALGSPLEKRTLWMATTGLAAIYLTQTPSVCEGFYWLAGGATYQFALVLMLLLLACCLSVGQEESTGSLVLKSLAVIALAPAVAGSNETMLPLGNLLLLTATLVAWRRRHPSRIVWTAALVGLFLGSLVVALSPGNAHRASLFAGRPPLAVCVLSGAWAAVRYTLKWSVQPMLVGATILSLPMVGNALRRIPGAGKIRLWHLVVSTLATISVVGLLFAPTFLSIGRKPPPRAMNVAFFFFLVGWCATVPIAVAWFRNSRGREFVPSPRTMALGRVALLAGVLLMGNLPRAVYDLVCLAPAYHRQLKERYALLHDRSERQEDAIIEPLTARPKTICFGDIGEEPSQIPLIASYFGVPGIKRTVPP